MIAALLLALAVDTVRLRAGESIQATLATAAPGDVIVLSAGRYPGNVVLDRRVTLLTRHGAVIRGDGRGSVVRVAARGARLDGFVIEHGGSDLDRDDAGVHVSADSVRLEDLVIRDVLHGVYLHQVREVAIRRVTIRGRAAVAPNDRGDGVHFFHSARVTATGNDIADVRDGMYFSYTDSTTVRHNRVARSRYGLHYMFSHVNRFEDNWFIHSAAGSSIMNSRDVVARRNVFAWNRGVESFGLLQQTTERTVLDGNVFAGNGTGLLLDGAVDGVVINNLVAGNFVGLALSGNAVGNRITGNHIEGNTYPATGAAGDSRFCVDGRGNWWGGRGFDLDGDGARDTPYRASSPLIEISRERPALRLYLGSPAAAALEWAERALPVFQVASVQDSCPLPARPASLPDEPVLATVPGGGAARLAAGATLALGLLALARFQRAVRP